MHIVSSFYKCVVDFIQEKIEMRGVEFVRLKYDNDDSYSYTNSNSEELCILGRFLRYDCETFRFASFRKWVIDEEWLGGCGELTSIAKEDGCIYLSDLRSNDEDDDYYVELKIPVEQLIKIMDEWQVIINLEKKPKEIILKRKNNQFIFETYD